MHESLLIYTMLRTVECDIRLCCLLTLFLVFIPSFLPPPPANCSTLNNLWTAWPHNLHISKRRTIPLWYSPVYCLLRIHPAIPTKTLILFRDLLSPYMSWDTVKVDPYHECQIFIGEPTKVTPMCVANELVKEPFTVTNSTTQFSGQVFGRTVVIWPKLT